MNAFRSEWVKLSRPSLLLGVAGSMVAAVLLATFGILRIASVQRERAGGGGGRFLASTISAPEGWLAGVNGATSLIGIAALVLFASNIGGEYKQGTLRALLAAEPRRLRLLAGKTAALATCVAGAVATALVVGFLAALAFAGMFDIDSSRWVSGQGVVAGLQAFLNIALACVGWGVLGGFLALVMRTSAAAIGIGVGYLLVGETLLSRAIVAPVFDVEKAWFPGEVLRMFATGGGAGSSYVRAALLALLYMGVLAAVGATLFARRDVVQ